MLKGQLEIGFNFETEQIKKGMQVIGTKKIYLVRERNDSNYVAITNVKLVMEYIIKVRNAKPKGANNKHYKRLKSVQKTIVEALREDGSKLEFIVLLVFIIDKKAMYE